MTRLYLYAICGRDGAVDVEVRGIGGSRVRLLPLGGLAAACSPVEAVPEPSERALWEHEAVVERLMESVPVLPVRFGTVVREDELPSLARRADEFTRALARVRGKVEYAVRVTWPDTPAPHDSLAAVAALHRPLARLAADNTVNVHRRPTPMLEAAYLVDREHADAFEAEVDRLTRDANHLAAVCTGPWPPYTFVSEAA